MKLIQPLRAKDTLVYLAPVPTETEGYLVIDPDTDKAEVICYDKVGVNYVETKVDPNSHLTEGVGRGLDGTQQTDHDTFAVVEPYNMLDLSNLSNYVKNGSDITINIGDTQIIIRPHFKIKEKNNGNYST